VSGLFQLNLRDFINGLIMAVGTAVMTFFEQLISNGTLSFVDVNWKLVGGVAAAAAVMYIAKNLGTTSNGKTFGIQATIPAPPAPPPKG